MISYNIDPFFLTPGAIDTSRFYDITFYVSFIMITMIFMKYFSCVTYEAKVCLVSLFMYNVFYRNEPHNAMHSYLLVKEGKKKVIFSHDHPQSYMHRELPYKYISIR